MTDSTSRTGLEPAPDRKAALPGLRRLVVAGAARVEADDTQRTVANWRPADREWPGRTSWRTRNVTQEGAADEQHR
ncbi:MAG: hypothetical protein ABR602_07265 [Gemmatimonadales bacterium]